MNHFHDDVIVTVDNSHADRSTTVCKPFTHLVCPYKMCMTDESLVKHHGLHYTVVPLQSEDLISWQENTFILEFSRLNGNRTFIPTLSHTVFSCLFVCI